MRAFRQTIVRSILDLVYPRFCYICGCSLAESLNLYFCYPCWRKISIIRHSICSRCGSNMGKGAQERKKCPHCQNKTFHFHQARSVSEYEGNMKQILLAFKFHGMEELQYPLSAMMSRQVRNYPFPHSPDISIPVPMWPSSERKRGYNQSALLAQNVSKELGIPCATHALQKVRQTLPQSELNKEQRATNLRDAFIVSDRRDQQALSGKVVLLVDDILTTGATANECAMALKKCRVKKVYVLTAARTHVE